MAIKLCLQWNDFRDNIKNAFGHLRDTTDFVNVTLVTQIKNETTDDSKIGGNALALPIRLKTSIMSTNLQELEETVKAMMLTSENLIQEGKWLKRAKICKACGKEGPSSNIKQHITWKDYLFPATCVTKYLGQERFWVIIFQEITKNIDQRDDLRKHRKSNH